MRQLSVIVFALAWMIPRPSVAQGPVQAGIARSLRSGTLQQRHQVINDVFRIPAAQRTDELWMALADELQRVADESHARTDALIAGRQVPSLGEGHGEYFGRLVEAISEWQDPRALRPLISGGGGMMATRAIVRFGEAAVPPVLQAVRTGHRTQRGGMLITLSVFLEGSRTYNIPPTVLTSTSRAQIVELSRDQLRPGASSASDLPLVTKLALATGDRALRQQVELLAKDRGELARLAGAVDASQAERVQKAIQSQLSQ